MKRRSPSAASEYSTGLDAGGFEKPLEFPAAFSGCPIRDADVFHKIMNVGLESLRGGVGGR
jgi:hypothetical protein